MKTAYIHVTNQCNYSCIYCYSNSGSKTDGELSGKEIIELVSNLIDHDVGKIVITGGEPFLREDLVEILRAIKKLNSSYVPICVNSNGSLINEKTARKIVGTIDEFRISIDGTETINDIIRGFGTYREAIRAFRTLIKFGFEPIAGITISEKNYRSVPLLIEELSNNGVKRIKLSPLRSIGRARANQEDADISKHLRYIREVVDLTSFEYSTIDLNSEISHCGVGHFLNILANGDVFPCHVLCGEFFRLGNIRTDSLENLLNGDRLTRLRSIDFRVLSELNQAFKDIVKPLACLGVEYEFLDDKDKRSLESFLI